VNAICSRAGSRFDGAPTARTRRPSITAESPLTAVARRTSWVIGIAAGESETQDRDRRRRLRGDQRREGARVGSVRHHRDRSSQLPRLLAPVVPGRHRRPGSGGHRPPGAGHLRRPAQHPRPTGDGHRGGPRRPHRRGGRRGGAALRLPHPVGGDHDQRLRHPGRARARLRPQDPPRRRPTAQPRADVLRAGGRGSRARRRRRPHDRARRGWADGRGDGGRPERARGAQLRDRLPAPRHHPRPDRPRRAGRSPVDGVLAGLTGRGPPHARAQGRRGGAALGHRRGRGGTTSGSTTGRSSRAAR
jgi:hypothetical protein